MNVFEGVIVDMSSDNHLNNNESIGNGTYGIDVGPGSTGNHVNGNTALGNHLFDLFDGNLNCDNNKWNGNTLRHPQPDLHPVKASVPKTHIYHHLGGNFSPIPPC